MDNLQEFSESKVDELISDLREQYEGFEVNEKTWQVSDEGFERESENFRNCGYGGAGIWLTNDEGKVLLVKNKGVDAWGDPGGHHENVESYEAAAKREVKEETNVEARIEGLETVDKIKMQHEEEDEKTLYNLLVIFRGKHVSGEPKPQKDEIEEVKWWGEHPENLLYEDLKQFTIPRKSEKTDDRIFSKQTTETTN